MLNYYLYYFTNKFCREFQNNTHLAKGLFNFELKHKKVSKREKLKQKQ